MHDPRHEDHNAHGDHDHDHDHAHPHDHAPPSDDDAAVSAYEVLERAIRSLLIDKGVLTAQDVQAQIDLMDSRTPALGSKVVAKAWTDPAYKQRLLADGRAGLMELGIDFGTLADLKVVESTSKVHNLVVCTLCSCYPKLLLGIPPAWYKSSPYRARAVRDPRGVLAEFGVTVGDETEVRVHDSTADLRYLVLPLQPKGTDGWTASRLAGLVTRDSMIGVAMPQAADGAGAQQKSRTKSQTTTKPLKPSAKPKSAADRRRSTT